MILKIRNSKTTKVIACLLLISFIGELMQPFQLYALTGGPSQPEMAGFTPLSTDNMVDLFSGNFHYTIPLMTVPGPDGGYPINLNYNSEVGMEYEASWVGLGWNLNPGAINRQVRGIPDDFAGDHITKTYKRRSNNTFIFTTGVGGSEIFGTDFGVGIGTSQSLVYNTFNGVSLSQRFGVSASYVRDRKVKDNKNQLSVGLSSSVNFDSDNGITPSFSMNGGYKNLSFGANFGYNSKSGTYSFGNQISLQFPQKETTGTNTQQNNDKLRISAGIGSSFSTAANLPSITIPLQTRTFGLSFQVGGSGNNLEGYGNVSTNVCIQDAYDAPIITKSYGLLYADRADKQSLQDFNREKDICVTNNSLNLPLPVMTNDVYSINGEQLTGSFRAFRSDYGHFSDNYIQNQTGTTSGGVDLAFGTGVQIGLGINQNQSFSENGDWFATAYDNRITYKDKYKYQDAPTSQINISPSLYEPFYFKMTGEQTASPLSMMDNISGSDLVCFPITTRYTPSAFGSLMSDYTINNTLRDQNSEDMTMSHTTQGYRTKRTLNIEYETGTTGQGRQATHVKEFSVVNAEGRRYTYGKTLYNHIEKEVTFSLPYQGDSLNTSVVTGYDTKYAKPDTRSSNRAGKERLYSCTETPPYAYSYLLTSVTSPDYVDITGNGPSDDDFGSWVKFDYRDVYDQSNLYQWRFPYAGANFFMGDRSNQNDDKGSYNYGKKEISYVKKIETKTHYAQFFISLREDSYDVNDEFDGGQGCHALYKLDSIKLFSKGDTSIPIKTVCFEYDYSLCPSVPNNVNGGGKLTLKKVYFKYAANEKGRENPYTFVYSDMNPGYNPVSMDRWGNYKGNANYCEHYVTQQNDSLQDLWAKAWLLTRINLPAGGSVEIEYESDRYAYVQNKQATYMAKMNPLTSFNKENGKYYVYFDKESGVDARQYVSAFKHNLMFFKVAVEYQSGDIPDYVQGYVEVNPNNTSNVSATVGKVEVKAFSAYDVHPIYFLCCQYLKNNRPDLMFAGAEDNESESDAASFFRALVSEGIIAKFFAMYGNDKFYRYCLDKHYFRTLTFNSAMPSYIRLNSVDKMKAGGGNRVKSITILDNWSKSAPAFYKQEYFYTMMENGKLVSSGVAEYEPTVGAEENALRYPVYDQVQGLFFKEDEMYSEEPYGESYFPAANVGYSQVTVKTYTPANVNLSAAGIQVHQFYTARDFPIAVSQTSIIRETSGIPNLVNIVTGGFMQASTSAFSQGYRIELNDMHGKPKMSATYPFVPLRDEYRLIAAIPNMGATSKIEYLYKEKMESGLHKVDNAVEVLTADREIANAVLGQTYDFVIDQRQNYSLSIGGGANAQLMLPVISPPPIPTVSVIPSFDSYEENVRSVATTKVIYNSGILEKTIAYNNGSKITTTHKLWDPYTGKPLLTTVTNEYEQPVYSYSMPAYWSYPTLGSAAENYRALFCGNTSQNVDSAFKSYDRMNFSGDRCPLQVVVGDTAAYWTPSGTQNFGSIVNKEVLRSRKSNWLNAVNATIVSLENPITGGHNPMLEAFNVSTEKCFSYTDCFNNLKRARVEYYNNRFYFFADDENIGPKFCTATMQDLLYSVPFVVSPPLPHFVSDVLELAFIKNGSRITVVYRNTGEVYTIFEWNDPKNLFPDCLDGVLQASAAEFQPAWTYDYADVGIVPLSSGQEHYLGIPNIYRSLRANLYVTERKQEGQDYDYKTNAAYDGTFNVFTYFNHEAGNAANLQKPWTWTAEITQYSPFNFEIENKNALNIYSAALYGYANSLATAVANNARYCEMGFDSFENDLSIAPGTNRGHIQCNAAGVISVDYAHTGKRSLKMNTPLNITVQTVSALSQSTAGDLTLQKGKTYLFSCWVRPGSCLTLDNLGMDYRYSLDGGSQTLINKEEKIDCWQRLEFEFTVPMNTSTQLVLAILPASTDYYYWDDIRIMPANATLKSYVYDPANYRLIAELDENNYATLYNYDEEGIVVQIKKETEKGIMTLKTTRQNLKK